MHAHFIEVCLEVQKTKQTYKYSKVKDEVMEEDPFVAV